MSATLYVCVTGAANGVPVPGAPSETIAVEVPDKTYESYRYSEKVAVAQFARRHGLKPVASWGPEGHSGAGAPKKATMVRVYGIF